VSANKSTAPVIHQAQGRLCKSQWIHTDPCPSLRTQRIFGSVPCPIDGCYRLYGYEPTLSWFTAWAAKELEIVGWNGCQSGLVVLPTPCLVHRSSQSISKELL
jgi:hypothetical protein